MFCCFWNLDVCMFAVILVNLTESVVFGMLKRDFGAFEFRLVCVSGFDGVLMVWADLCLVRVGFDILGF